MKIPLTKTYFDKSEEKAVIETIRSGWVFQGVKVEKFENEIKKYLGAKYVAATSTGTSALFLSLLILGIKRGDEVILPSFTFISCANVVVQLGATPVFADIDQLSFNIDPKDIERKITKKTKAILAVDQIGLPADLQEIKALCKKFKIFLLEDAACALGSRYKNKKVGTNFSDIACFSFHPRKNITTGEGGVIVTNNFNWYKQALILRNHGIGLNGKFEKIGFNFRMTDLQASIGIEQLKKIDFLIKKRKKLAKRYINLLRSIKSIHLPYNREDRETNWQSFMIRLSPKINISRLIKSLQKKGISVKEGIPPIHLQQPYKKLYKKILLPETKKASNETLFLPLYPQMSIAEQDFVIKSIKNLC